MRHVMAPETGPRKGTVESQYSLTVYKKKRNGKNTRSRSLKKGKKGEWLGKPERSRETKVAETTNADEWREDCPVEGRKKGLGKEETAILIPRKTGIHQKEQLTVGRGFIFLQMVELSQPILGLDYALGGKKGNYRKGKKCSTRKKAATLY